MVTKRIAQVNELLRQELGKIFSRELELPRGCLITISKAETSPDCEQARVWIKIFPVNFDEEVLHILKKRRKQIQHLLNKRLVMRSVPRVTFHLDVSEEKAARIDQLIDQIHKQDG